MLEQSLMLWKFLSHLRDPFAIKVLNKFLTLNARPIEAKNFVGIG